MAGRLRGLELGAASRPRDEKANSLGLAETELGTNQIGVKATLGNIRS